MNNEESTLTNRQKWLFNLLLTNSNQGKRLSVEKIVNEQKLELEQGTLPYANLYQFADNDIYKNCPAIYEDKDQINESDEVGMVVCCKDREFYIGSEEENILYHNKLYKKICDYSHKCKVVRDKISANGQLHLFDVNSLIIAEKEGISYNQAFIKNQSLLKTIDSLKEEVDKLQNLIKAYKNENQMWKDRYYSVKGENRNGN